MTYFISDTHFGHKNIINYCDRPFNTVEQMNEFMIKQWNSVVNKKDVVYHLGDFSLTPKPDTLRIMEQLNGTKYLIKGNHDTYTNQFYRDIGFKEIYDHPIIIQEFLVLSHEPIPWKISPIFLNLYGHIHTSELFETWGAGAACMCVERHNYTPVSIEVIKQHYS